jgi:hypothetical protein
MAAATMPQSKQITPVITEVYRSFPIKSNINQDNLLITNLLSLKSGVALMIFKY